MARKKRVLLPAPNTNTSAVKYEYVVRVAFEQYAKGQTIYDPAEVQAIQGGLHAQKITRVEARSLSGTGDLLTRMAVRPQRHINLSIYSAQRQKMLANPEREISMLGIDLGLIADKLLREQVLAALRGYHLTENPLFIFELMRLLPPPFELTRQIRGLLNNMLASTLRSAYAIAFKNHDAPSPEDAVKDSLVQIGIAGEPGTENAFSNFESYHEQLKVAQAINEAIKGGMNQQRAVPHVALMFGIAEKTAEQHRVRFRVFIKPGV